jgi:hypothetical protein
MRSTPDRAQWSRGAPNPERAIAVPASPPKAAAMLCQQTAPGGGKRLQPHPHRGPGRPWLRCAEHPLDLPQVGLHTLPEYLPQPLVHLAPPGS